MSSQPKWQRPAPPDSSKRPCILYIEENEASFRQVKSSLENFGYNVIGAANGWQALALLLNSPISLVLGGEALCTADGAELVQKIKGIKPNVPVILCSRTLPHSMKDVDAFVSADMPSSNFQALIKNFLDRYAA